MLNKKMCILGLFLILGVSAPRSDAQWRYRHREKQKGRLSVVVHVGNLTGVGLGCNYAPSSTYDIDILVGAGSPAYIIWASPYVGNTFNLSVRMNFHLVSVFYVGVGGYVGYFEVSRELDDVEVPEYMWVSAPIVSFGAEYPRKSKRKVGFEVGSAFAIPTEVSRTITGFLTTHVIKADRSESALGFAFPFFTFFIRI